MEKEVAVFGGGCFWCTEAVFQGLGGVLSVTPGYAGGKGERPTYESIHTSKTGHAEVIKIEYDPAVISYETLLAVFFSTHDPTTRNRQNNDIGEEYRSLLLYASEDQKNKAVSYIKKLENDTVFKNSIVTELQPLDAFFEAEEEHKNFYEKNQSKPYCQIVINPKLQKLQQQYSHLLK